MCRFLQVFAAEFNLFYTWLICCFNLVQEFTLDGKGACILDSLHLADSCMATQMNVQPNVPFSFKHLHAAHFKCSHEGLSSWWCSHTFDSSKPTFHTWVAIHQLSLMFLSFQPTSANLRSYLRAWPNLDMAIWFPVH